VLRNSLRDIAGSLASSPTLEDALESLLVYLRALQPDWHPSVATYAPEAQLFDAVYQLDRKHLHRRAVAIPVDHLPVRLVRNYIQPSAIFNGGDRRTILEKLFRQSPGYEPDRFEGQQLQPLTAPVGWRSCACLPLNDRDDLLGLIVLVCPRPNAFGSATLESLQPLRGLASLAIARRLHDAGRPTPESRAEEEAGRVAREELHARLRALEAELGRLTAESEARGATLQAALREAEQLRAAAIAHDDERRETTRKVAALEEQVGVIGLHLSEACTSLADAELRVAEAAETLDVVSDAFELIAGDPDPASITRTFVSWFCERFRIGRLSVMRNDCAGGALRILAHRGMDPGVAARVRVPVGQGVAGWVAHNRRALLVRQASEHGPVHGTGLDRYNSESFISLPLVHRREVVGVLNMSNKRHGEPFDQVDLERARLASHVLAFALGEAIAA